VEGFAARVWRGDSEGSEKQERWDEAHEVSGKEIFADGATIAELADGLPAAQR